MLVRPHPSDREPGILTDKKEGRGWRAAVQRCRPYEYVSLVLSTLTGTIRFLKKRDFLIHFQNSMVCVCYAVAQQKYLAPVLRTRQRSICYMVLLLPVSRYQSRRRISAGSVDGIGTCPPPPSHATTLSD